MESALHGQQPWLKRRTSIFRLLSLGLIVLCSIGPFIAVADTSARIDINQASASELAKGLPGIGPVKAGRIVDYRERHGPFDALQALLQIKGIGPRTLEHLAPLVTLGADIEARAASREQATVSAVRRIVAQARGHR